MPENDVVDLALKKLKNECQLMIDQAKREIDSWKGKVSLAIEKDGSFADLTEKLRHVASLEDSSKNNILIELANRVREQTILELCKSFGADPEHREINSAHQCIEHVLEEKFSKQMLQKCGYTESFGDVKTLDKAVKTLKKRIDKQVSDATKTMTDSISQLRQTINPSAESEANPQLRKTINPSAESEANPQLRKTINPSAESEANPQLPSPNVKETLDFLHNRATDMRAQVKESCDELPRQRAACNSHLDELYNIIGNSFVKDLGESLKKISQCNEEITAFAKLTTTLTEALGQLLGYARSDKSDSEILKTVADMCAKCVKAVQDSVDMDCEGKGDIMKKVKNSLSEMTRVIKEVRSLFAIEDGNPLEYESNWPEIKPADTSLLCKALGDLHRQLETVTEIRVERDQETAHVKGQLSQTRDSYNDSLRQLTDKQQEVDSLSKEKQDVEKKLKAQFDRESSRNEMLRLLCEAQVRKVEAFYQKRVPPTE